MKKILFAVVATLLLAATTQAQELNCRVQINAQKAQNVDQRVFKTLEGAMKDFMDGRKWTDDVFKNEERINCSITMIINEAVTQTQFKASITVQASRPVFNSNYETVLMTFVDKDVLFDYQENAPIDLNDVSPANNLSALCGFYAYTLLGMDYDSFSLLGGQPYFQKAQALINAVPTSFGDKNWKPATGDRQRTRYWVIESLMNPRATPMRKAMYDYYINGLDLMYEKPTEAQITIGDAIDKVDKVNRDLPASMAIQLFIDSKSNEIVQIYNGSASPARPKVGDVMIRIDGANATKYGGLMR